MSDNSWLYGENKVQNVTIINANVSEDMPQFLESNFANTNLDQSRIFGSALGRSRGMPHSLVSLRRYEPVFHHRNASRITGHEEVKENTVSVFQTLNGLFVDPRASLQQFRREFRCPGMSMTDYDFDHGEQTPSGVAVAIAGSMDIVNNSAETWRPGDRLVFDTPALDRKAYLSFKKSLPPIEGEDPGRVRFIIRPVRFVEQRLWFENALTRFYSEDGPLRFTVDRMFDSDVATIEDNEFRTANGYITFVRSIMYATIAALLNAGVNDLTLPGTGYAGGATGTLAQKNAYRGYLAQLDRTLPEIDAALGAAAVPGHKAAVETSMRTWALMLGLVPLGAQGADADQKAAQRLVQYVVGCVSRGALLSPDLARYQDILNLFPDASKATAFTITQTANGLSRFRPNLDDRLGAIHHIVSSSLQTTLRGFKESVEDQWNSYVATANAVTEPSNPGNVRRS